MGVIFQTSYSLPGGDEPLTHARIAHSGNWLAGGTATASTTDADYFANGPLNSLTYEKWKPTALPATWEYDHGSAAAVDYCVIGAHTMGTNGNTLEIQYWNGSAWVDVIPATAIADDSPIFAIFGEQTRQRWRIQISNGTVPTVGVVKFGTAMQMERPLYGDYVPADYARQTVLRSNYSEGGEFLGRTKVRTHLEFGIGWRMLTRSWVDANWYPFILAIETEPFFLAPMPSVYSEVSLCQTLQSPDAPSQGADGFLAVDLDVRAYGYE